MADQRGSRMMLTLLAMLATGFFVGCNQPALALHGADSEESRSADEQQPAQATEPAAPKAAPADQKPAGQQTGQQPQQDVPSADPTPQPSPDDIAPSDGDQIQNVQSDEGGADVDSTDTKPDTDDGGADTEDGNQESDDEELDEKKWRIPTRGSGGDSPPDYIAPSDPKTV